VAPYWCHPAKARKTAVASRRPDRLCRIATAGDEKTVIEGSSSTEESITVLLVANDDYARLGSDIVAEPPASVRSGKTWHELIAEQSRDAEG
jgi:hypothetical protein